MARDFPIKKLCLYYEEPFVMLPNINGKTVIGNFPKMNIDVG
jgi:hypothetical protein